VCTQLRRFFAACVTLGACSAPTASRPNPSNNDRPAAAIGAATTPITAATPDAPSTSPPAPRDNSEYAEIVRALPAPTPAQYRAFAPSLAFKRRGAGVTTLLTGIDVLVYLDPDAGKGDPQTASGYAYGLIEDEATWLAKYGHLHVAYRTYDAPSVDFTYDKPKWEPKDGRVLGRASPWERYRPTAHVGGGEHRTFPIPDLPESFDTECTARVYPYFNPRLVELRSSSGIQEPFLSQFDAIVKGHPHPERKRLIQLYEWHVEAARIRTTNPAEDVGENQLPPGVVVPPPTMRHDVAALPAERRRSATLRNDISDALLELHRADLKKVEQALENLRRYVETVKAQK
jgi:hypothetical protein